MRAAATQPLIAMRSAASQPLLALRSVAVRAVVAQLTLLVTVSAIVRTLAAWRRATPAYFPDEYMYSEFGRSLAGGMTPVVRGVPAHFLPLLQPLLTSPGWLFSDVETGYRTVQAIDSVLMSLAAIPIYLLARRIGLGPRYALAGAVLGLTLPSLLLSGFIVSEPVAYPLVLGAIAAAVHALDRPSARSYSVFIALTALAMFTRMQFAVLLPCFLVALVALAVRERRVHELARTHWKPIALLLVAGAALFALGPARNTGYYPSFLFVPGFHPLSAAEFFAVDALVLVFACGFVLFPGAAIGVWLALRSARSRVELAFGVLTLVMTLALLLEAVVYGNLGFVQERYLFYLLPLWILSFLLYAQRGWPLRRAHACVALGLVAAALTVPLTKYAGGGGQAHSAFLFAVARVGQAAGSLETGAYVIAAAAAVGVLVVIGVSYRRVSSATQVTVALALVFTIGASVAATLYDEANARTIAKVTLGNDPSWVDRSGVERASMLLPPGSRLTDAQLFWNRKLDRLLLLPGVVAPDAFAADSVSVGSDGTLAANGAVVDGPVVVDDWGTDVQLQGAKLIARSPGHLLFAPTDRIRLGMLTIGRYADGWLAARGTVLIWPKGDLRGVAGRLEIPVRAPGSQGVTLRFAVAGSGRPLVRHVAPGRGSTIVIPVCSRGPVALQFDAAPVGGLGDGRAVAAMTGKPRYVPIIGGCTG